MNDKPLYGFYLSNELIEQAVAAGVLERIGDDRWHSVDAVHLTRRHCNCYTSSWGWGLHARTCPVYRFYECGGIHSQDVVTECMCGGVLTTVSSGRAALPAANAEA